MGLLHSIETLSLPENKEDRTDHPDKGCSLAPRCLECPLPRCRYDPVNGRQWRVRPKGIPNRRNERIAPAANNRRGSPSPCEGRPIQ